MSLNTRIKTSIKRCMFVGANELLGALYGFSRLFTEEADSVALIRTDNLGDLIIFGGTLPGYRRAYPGKKLVLFVSDAGKEFAQTVLLKNQLVDEVVSFDRERFAHERIYFLRIFFTCLIRPYGIAINTVSGRRIYIDVIMNVINARTKIGTYGDYSNVDRETLAQNDFIYDRLFSAADMRHEIEKDRALIADICGKAIETRTDWLRSHISHVPAVSIFPQLEGQRFCVIFPNSARSWGNWPVERFAEICRLLEQVGVISVICGTAADQETCARVASLSKNSINAAGKLSIIELASLIEDSLFYFGNDTGIAHLSMAVGAVTFSIQGLGHFGRFFPYPDQDEATAIYDAHAPCMNDNWQCIQGRMDKPAPCIESISVEYAWQKLKAFLGRPDK